MKQEKEFETIRKLLSGKVKNPSPRFEHALEQIPKAPATSVPSTFQGVLRVGVVAAACLALVWAGLLPDWRAGPDTIVLEDDPQMLAAFVMADKLATASSLLNEDHLLVIDYLTSTP